MLGLDNLLKVDLTENHLCYSIFLSFSDLMHVSNASGIDQLGKHKHTAHGGP